MRHGKTILICAFVLGFSIRASVGQTAPVRFAPASIFTDNMVLQRDKPLKVWGTGKDGAEVVVEVAGQTHRATCTNNSWSVTLSPLEESLHPIPFIIRADDETRVFGNVVVGEVWFAGGQSNMTMVMRLIPGGIEEITRKPIPQIRHIIIPRRAPTMPPLNKVDPVTWYSPDAETAKGVSAIAYYFSRRIYEELAVPVGIINCNYGGTPIEAWMSPESFETSPSGRKIWEAYQEVLASKTMDEHNAARDTFVEELQQFYRDLGAWSRAGKKDADARPTRPKPPQGPYDEESPSALFKGMVEGTIGYGIRGLLWYQGESNVRTAETYEDLFRAMIVDLRTRWQDPKLPFYFVQLSAFDHQGIRVEDKWPIIRHAQYRVWQEVPLTGMVVSMDLGEKNNIHPKKKAPVAERLARYALRNEYDFQDMVTTGPVYASHSSRNGTLILTFKHCEKGLISNSQELLGFEVAGTDKKYTSARASIISPNQVKLEWSSKGEIVHARYGWRNFIKCTLYNGEGLPAVPFSTEPDWSPISL